MSSLDILAVGCALLLGGGAPVPTTPAGDAPTADLRIGLPGLSWALWIHPADFEFGHPTPGPTGATVWASGDAIEPGLSMTVVLRPIATAERVEDCRERMSRRAGVGSCDDRGVECLTIAGMATFEYELEGHGTLPFAQRHVRAYLHHDGVCGEIHMTKTNYRRRDRAELVEVLESVERVDVNTGLPPGHSD